MQIYINRDGQQFGPYTLPQARDYLESGNLVADDLAWYDEDIDWVPLGEVPGMAGPIVAPEPVRSNTPTWVPPRRETTTMPSIGFPGRSTPTVTVNKSFSAPPPPPPNASLPVPPASAPPPTQKIFPSRAGDPFRRATLDRAKKNMIVGGLFFVGGLAVTLFSYEAAAQTPHGTFIMAWGAILFGAIRMILGVFQRFKA